MKQQKCIFAALVFGLIFFSSNYAQELSVGGGGFYILKNPTIQNGFGYQVNFAVKTQRRLAMLASIGHYQESTSPRQSAFNFPYSFSGLTAPGNYLLDGDFTLTFFELSPVIDLFEIKIPKAILSIGAGLGLYYAKNRWNENTYYGLFLSQAQDSLFYSEGGIGPDFGVNFRAALNIPATPRSIFSVEAKYVYYKPEIHYEIHTPALSDSYIRNREIDLSTLSVSISLMLVL